MCLVSNACNVSQVSLLCKQSGDKTGKETAWIQRCVCVQVWYSYLQEVISESTMRVPQDLETVKIFKRYGILLGVQKWDSLFFNLFFKPLWLKSTNAHIFKKLRLYFIITSDGWREMIANRSLTWQASQTDLFFFSS